MTHECKNCENLKQRFELSQEALFWALETAAKQKKKFRAKTELLSEVMDALKLINTDKDGNGFICKEAMGLIYQVIEKYQNLTNTSNDTGSTGGNLK